MDDQLTLRDVVRFVSRNVGVIVGTSLAFGLVAAVLLLVFVNKEYEASATLVVVPPPYSSDLKPPTLTMVGYQKLLESDAVIDETRRTLIADGVLPSGAMLRRGRDLNSRIFMSQRREEVSVAPMIEAMGMAEDPTAAAAITNTWADVFLRRVGGLMAGTTSQAVTFIEDQYPKAQHELADLEEDRNAAIGGYQDRYNTAAATWDRRIAAYDAETTDLVAGYEAETRRLSEESRTGKRLDNRTDRLKALRAAYAELQGEQARVASQVQSQRLELEAAEKQLAETPKLVTLEKAIPDEALWEVLVRAKTPDEALAQLQERKLVTQQLNPEYTDLRSTVSQLQMSVNALTPRAAQLTERLDEMETEIHGADVELGDDTVERDRLLKMRGAGLQSLQGDRAATRSDLDRRRSEALAAIEREWETRVGQLDRVIDRQRTLFGELAKQYNEATLAKAQQDVEDVRLAAPAVVPERPLPRGRAWKGLLAMFVGALVGLGIAGVREALAGEAP